MPRGEGGGILIGSGMGGSPCSKKVGVPRGEGGGHRRMPHLHVPIPTPVPAPLRVPMLVRAVILPLPMPVWKDLMHCLWLVCDNTVPVACVHVCQVCPP